MQSEMCQFDCWTWNLERAPLALDCVERAKYCGILILLRNTVLNRSQEVIPGPSSSINGHILHLLYSYCSCCCEHTQVQLLTFHEFIRFCGLALVLSNHLCSFQAAFYPVFLSLSSLHPAIQIIQS